MNEGAGATQVQDMSSNVNHGAINGASWMISPAYTVTYDYSATPRITDVALSALSHLCIPIDPAWNLDGKPLYSYCPVFSSACSETEYTLPYIYQNTYHATQSIFSNAVIDGANIQFKAGNLIELEQGFQVKPDVDFDAVIEDCN